MPADPLSPIPPPPALTRLGHPTRSGQPRLLIDAIGGVDRGPQFIERLLHVCADPLLLNLQRLDRLHRVDALSSPAGDSGGRLGLPRKFDDGRHALGPGHRNKDVDQVLNTGGSELELTGVVDDHTFDQPQPVAHRELDKVGRVSRWLDAYDVGVPEATGGLTSERHTDRVLDICGCCRPAAGASPAITGSR